MVEHDSIFAFEEKPAEEGRVEPEEALDDDPEVGGTELAESDVDAPRSTSLGCYSCPWCLHRPREFEETHMGETACGNCRAVIPVEAAWYQRGEKIVV